MCHEGLDVRRRRLRPVPAERGQVLLGGERRLKDPIAVEERPARTGALVDDETVGGHLDLPGVGIPVGIAQGRRLAGMDVEDLREFIGGGGNQDRGVHTAPCDRSARRRIAQIMVTQPVSGLRRRGRGPQVRPFAALAHPSAARRRGRARHHDVACQSQGKICPPGSLSLRARSLVDDDVVEKDLVLARDERGRVKRQSR